MNPKKVLVVFFEPGSVLEELKNIFKGYDLPVIFKAREEISSVDFQDVELVVSVGGDGTFLADR